MWSRVIHWSTPTVAYFFQASVQFLAGNMKETALGRVYPKNVKAIPEAVQSLLIAITRCTFLHNIKYTLPGRYDDDALKVMTEVLMVIRCQDHLHQSVWSDWSE